MKKHLVTTILMTLITTLLLGVLYPLAVTLLAQVCFPDKANGQLIQRNGQTIGSRLIGQPFTGRRYFHSRPSAAGAGYDAANSSASNLGPTNRKLIDRIASDVSRLQGETTSGSGLDPDITQAGAEFQIPRVARERGMSEDNVRNLVQHATQGRLLGLLGEPRVNVLELNLALDSLSQNR
jgi:K+-transporting ATPase ATPase C chain